MGNDWSTFAIAALGAARTIIMVGEKLAERLASARSPAALAHGDADSPDPIPPRYVDARWRDMTPIDPATGTLGIGFQSEAGDTFLRLSVEDGSHIAEQFQDYLAGTNSHSEMSSGVPKSEVVSPDGTEKWTPTYGSEAAERGL